jgi:hypothetical protein
MIRAGVSGNKYLFIFKFLLIILLIISVFCLVYIRSGVLKLEYSLGELEKAKMERLKERKSLIAKKTSLISFKKLETSLNKDNPFVLPDRIKVIHIDKQKRYMPYKTSLERSLLPEP